MSEGKCAPVCVLGALNLDMNGMPDAPPRAGDSAPGRVLMAAGGVGHNIARALAEAGEAVELVCPLGDDMIADLLERLCAEAGIGLRHAVRVAGRSSAYLCVMDERGEMTAAVNDMAILERLTPDLLPALDAAPLVVLDANLPRATLEAAAGRAAAPLLLDPVSGYKAPRALGILRRLAAIKPNLLEAEAMSGRTGATAAADWFLARGVGRVFISMGAGGVHYADAGGHGVAAAPRMRVGTVTGAGDAMTGGIALGLLRGLDTAACAALGVESSTKHLLNRGGVFL